MTSTTTAPRTATEYGIAERVAGDLRPLPQCGTWYTDRYYTDDLTGRDAAEAALARVAATAPGTYEVYTVRTFLRAADAGLADALTDDELTDWLRRRGVCGDDLTEYVAEYRGSTLTQMDARYAAMHCEGDDPVECEGHESLDGAHMGETVYCDGTCR